MGALPPLGSICPLVYGVWVPSFPPTPMLALTLVSHSPPPSGVVTQVGCQFGLTSSLGGKSGVQCDVPCCGCVVFFHVVACFIISDIVMIFMFFLLVILLVFWLPFLLVFLFLRLGLGC